MSIPFNVNGAPSFPADMCVAGCGDWGKNLIRNLSRLGCLKGVCDADGSRADAFARQYGAKAFGSFEAALDDPGIKAVVLATPAEMHAPMVMRAIDAGKDVFVEKPLALRAKDGSVIVEKARQQGRIVMVGHLLLYHPAVRRIQELLRGGLLGDLEYIYSNRLSMGKIRREENALWSFAPHDVSVTLALAGEPPLQAAAVGGAYVQPRVADVTLSNLLFSHGVRAHIFVSWLHPYKEQRLVVIGSKKMAVFEDTRPTDKLLLFDKDVDATMVNAHIRRAPATPEPFDPSEPLLLECAHFAECVQERKQPLTDAESGVEVLRVLQACQRSIQLNGEPVQIGSSLEVLTL